jgi:hypothetical protein
MCDLEVIEKELKDSDGLRLRIIREIGERYGIALLTKSGTGRQMKLTLAGSGTLVMAGDSRYILTAAHVWEYLKKADEIGITMVEDRDHAFFMDARTIEPTIELRADKWNEWGPDLAFLKIPAWYVEKIQARKGFYSPSNDGKLPNASTDVIELRLLLGAPAELGTYTQLTANFTIDGCYNDPFVKPTTKDGRDYYDVAVALASDKQLKSYGGISGGGLWKILVHCSESEDRIVWSQRLIGVAFYELTDSDGRVAHSSPVLA